MQNRMSGKKNRILSALILILLLSAAAFPTRAAIKDADTDGLTDEAEIDTYQTDPYSFDTDGDGVPDGQEIIHGTGPLDPKSSILAPEEASSPYRILRGESVFWYIGRASGIFAFILFTIVVMNGLLMTTRLVFKILPPALNYEMHYSFSWVALLATLIHIASFTFDKFFHLSWAEALVPFMIKRDFASGLGFDMRWAVGTGTAAFYGILTLIITSEMKLRGKMSHMLWRATHYASFATYALFLLHGITAGTDSQQWWMIWIYSLSAFLVGSLIILRIFASIKKRHAGRTLPTASPDSN